MGYSSLRQCIVDLEKKYGELIEDLAEAEKIADLKALQAKYPKE